MTNRALRFEKARAKSEHITGINMHVVIDFFGHMEYSEIHFNHVKIPRKIEEDVAK